MSFILPAPAAAQEWPGFSADVDGDGLPNVVEEDGWFNESGGPYVTDPLDADTDDDGLPDGKEKLYDTDPGDGRSPGIFVEYEEDLQTRESQPPSFTSPLWTMPGEMAWSLDQVKIGNGPSLTS